MTEALSFEEKVSYLIDTPDDLLPCFSPLERATIMALKAMRKGDRKAKGSHAGSRDTNETGPGKHPGVRTPAVVDGETERLWEKSSPRAAPPTT
ncbi:hypothetical protein FGU65_01645 [Methanoculleus sp. FWC-SCC1]|uniref:Transposase n=1 Tax=Methanoculleus frigidifontis TaxID=2584085 RepID=A0ABT8M6R0_9EURY|nr:hypothetical protein [Methanoculleus sp. FWC-SCC1]MDN7023613.1 hypothetical protein [Methanoculleus sp. FWC-SCC1]